MPQLLLLLLYSFNGLFSRTTWVSRASRHQKSWTILVKPIWIYYSKRQWVTVASAVQYANLHLAQSDNHASTPPISFLQAGCPSCCPTNSVKALKAVNQLEMAILVTSRHCCMCSSSSVSIRSTTTLRIVSTYSVFCKHCPFAMHLTLSNNKNKSNVHIRPTKNPVIRARLTGGRGIQQIMCC